LYAKAGEEITFVITENTEKIAAYAEISIKSDSLTHMIGKKLTRFPNIGLRKFRLRNAAGDVFSSAHGGLIFIIIP
jgi:hypothetical protein